MGYIVIIIVIVILAIITINQHNHIKMIIHFRMIDLVGQKLLAAALIVGLSLGFGFLPAALAKKYFTLLVVDKKILLRYDLSSVETLDPEVHNNCTTKNITKDVDHKL